MTSKGIRYSALAGLIALTAAGCATDTPATTAATSAMTIAQARAQLNADIRSCTQRHGYDPTKVAGVAENSLAPNELAWRQCVYAALAPYTKANPATAAQYESLITSDIAMTSAIQQGTMTRSQRKARIEQLASEIKSAEDQLILATQAQQQREAREFDNTISAIRGLGN